ncbi:MAG TPA: DNA-formamidopyrimidine glycosylase family protein, partial [Acidimicrobiales bacterium]
MLEVEYYRRLAEKALYRPVAAVAVPDPHVLRGQVRPAALRRALVGRSLVAARRRGKLLLLDVDGALGEAVDGNSTGDRATGSGPGGAQPGGPTLGLRFGMTG